GAELDGVPDAERRSDDVEAALRELGETAGIAGASDLVERELEETGPAGGPAPAPEEQAEVVAESADPGAEEGAGAEVHWRGGSPARRAERPGTRVTPASEVMPRATLSLPSSRSRRLPSASATAALL